VAIPVGVGEALGGVPVLVVDEQVAVPDDGDVGPHLAEEVRQFDGDVAAADHDESVRALLEAERLVAREEVNLVGAVDAVRNSGS